MWCDKMIEDIEQKIKETAIEAIELSQKMRKVADENFIIHVSIPKRKRTATVTIQAVKRPFPINKFSLIQQAIGGKWDKTPTTCNFTKVTQLRHSSKVKLVINLYMRECLNPKSWDKVQVQRGVRGKVLNPDLCNGAEVILMQALNIKEK